MGGSNPYIEAPQTALPTRSYRLKFVAPGACGAVQEVTIDPTKLPTSGTGLPGSILDIALASGIDIDHACGGVCACSTCHVVVRSGLSTCNGSTDAEEDQLEKAPGLTPFSRLACQCVPDGSSDVVVEIPAWNRNLVREGN